MIIVREFENEAKELLIQVLSIPSVNHKDDEGKVAEYLQTYLTEAGIEAKVQRIDETHANLIAFIPGENPGKPTVWNGHIDTVPYGDLAEWETNPATPTEKDGKLYARGASDMKSGIAAMAYTLATIVKSGKKPAYDITLIGTCDEEKNGLGARELVKAGLLPDVEEVLIGEPTGLNIGIAQKGCLWLEFEVFGKTSHGAYPEQGANAVDYAVRMAERLKEFVTEAAHPILGNATAQITQITGGVAPNMTPDRCTVLMDMRLVPGQTKEIIIDKLEEIAKEYAEETEGQIRVEYHVKNDRIAVSTEPEDTFTKKLQKNIENNGVSPKNIGINYFTDGSIMLQANSKLKVLLFGAGEADLCHKSNEYVYLDKYYKSIEILTAYALDK